MRTQPKDTDLAERAPKRHQTRLKLLGLIPKQGRGVEIGVWDGKFSQVILDETNPTQLVLIDPWDMLSDDTEDTFVHSRWGDTDYMGAMYLNVARLYAHLPQVILCKGFSVPVLETFPDNYFDWMYIDGNHRYEHVLADLRVAARKLRVGGLIAGDDFFWKQDDRQQVREAVLDFLGEVGAGRKVTPLAQDKPLPGLIEHPSRIGQQFLIPVTDAIKSAL
ncbi:class I SAM-dependent methyltransferase [uncultured Roseovarius sp.]|uniref:class I SAM-dependent methyltransferase n=1 Tax=Roseovarius sp. TaxID=1486281 RepID=UPI0025F9E0B3|nr:class I SAM-dependent methyltransferase [uncultured Roseovarius sp.]